MYYYNQPPMNQQLMQQQFQQPQQPMLRGRIVTSVDEVRATPIILDGIESYFPYPSENSIYTKAIDINGNAIIKKYVLEKQTIPVDNTSEMLKDLQERIKTLEDLITSTNVGGN